MGSLARVGAALLAAGLACASLAGCDDPEPTADAAVDAGTPDPEPVFPADFAERYSEARDCRNSHEHELRYIRVLVSPEAREPYAALSPETPYPVGSTLVKEEYDDDQCETLLGYTAYKKLPKGENPAGGDWWWQKLDAERRVVEEGAPWRCINCHTVHCAPPYGFDLTCAEEI